MNPDLNNKPVLETVVIDGDAPTEQEAALMKEGLDGEGDGRTPDAAAAPAADAGGDAAAVAAAATVVPPTADEEAARVEAERVAAEQAEQQRIQNERAAAEAQANSDAIAKAAEASKPPEAPINFDEAFAALEQKREDDDIEPAAYATELRRLTRQEAEHTIAVQLWDAEQKRLAGEATAAAERSQNAWNAAALQWEADNADFMSNPMRQQNMQQAIILVTQNNRAAGVVQGAAEVLASAAKIAFDYSGYVPKTPVPAKDPKIAIAEAVGARRPEQPGTTLGDIPNAGNEPIRGNEAFSNLDGLSIEELEETVSHMTAAQQEKYLLDAPGAKHNGRGNDAAAQGQE